MSCLPSHDPKRTTGILYARLNVYQQEVLRVNDGDGDLELAAFVASSGLGGPATEARLMLAHRGLEVSDLHYPSGGQDQCMLWIRGAGPALRLLTDPAVVRAARLFNLRLMRKGACQFGRYHSYPLADLVLDQPATDAQLSSSVT